MARLYSAWFHNLRNRPSSISIIPPEKAGLYIHLPWCIQKCPYCDFNSHALINNLQEKDYVAAIIKDLGFESRQHRLPAIQSIFFGGGTPSLFSGDAIGQILDAAAKYLNIHSDAEITLEANPGATERLHLKAYAQAGVNRLSLGFQSMDDSMLERLGRIHRSTDSLKAYEAARAAGFENINIDIMFGLPEQALDQGIEDLQEVIDLKPEHVSWYQLAIEPNTRFAVDPPVLPDPDSIDDLHSEGIELLKTHGLARYEVSAYSTPGRQCKHNLNYWGFGDYIGIGAGAHGKISDTSSIRRYSRQKHPREYMKLAGSTDIYQQHETVQSSSLVTEYLLNNLRLVQGFDLGHFSRATGLQQDQLYKTLGKPAEMGLLSLTGTRCVTTALGYRHIDEILVMCTP